MNIKKKIYKKREKYSRKQYKINPFNDWCYVRTYDVIVHSCKGLKSSEYQLKISLG